MRNIKRGGRKGVHPFCMVYVLKIPRNIIPLNVIPVGVPTGEDKPKDKFKKEFTGRNGSAFRFPDARPQRDSKPRCFIFLIIALT